MAFLVFAALAQVGATVVVLRLNATRVGVFWGREVWRIEESGYRVGVREKIRVVDTPHEVVGGVLGAVLFGLSGLWPLVGIGWQLSMGSPPPALSGVGGVLAGTGLLSLCGSAVLVLRVGGHMPPRFVAEGSRRRARTRAVTPNAHVLACWGIAGHIRVLMSLFPTAFT